MKRYIEGKSREQMVLMPESLDDFVGEDNPVQGAEQVRAKVPDHVSVFITAADPEDYARRLRIRGADSPAAIARRMETARAELGRANEYKYQIRNDDLETAAAELAAVIDEAFETGVQ